MATAQDREPVEDRDPQGMAQSAEIAIAEEDWEALEGAAWRLLGLARRRRMRADE